MIPKRNRLFLVVYSCVLASSGFSQAVITTIAGVDLLPAVDGKPALQAPLGGIDKVILDGSGNVYLADEDDNQVAMIGLDGIVHVVAGNGLYGYSGDGGPATAASLQAPTGLALDASENLYISEQLGGRVRRVTKDGIISTFASGLLRPFGLTVDSQGNVYVADAVANRIWKITPSGTRSLYAGDGQSRFFGDGGPALQASFIGPLGIAVDQQDNLYVADALNHRVRKISSDGKISTVAGGGSSTKDGVVATTAVLFPLDVAFDQQGNLYISDYTSSGVKKVTTAQVIHTVSGKSQALFSGDGGPALNASFALPGGIQVDASGNIYVSDRGAHRLREITASDGIINSIAGNGKWRFSNDGIKATTAVLTTPIGVGVDGAGNIYFSDSLSYRVRKISTSGILTTVAGTGEPGASANGPSQQAMLSNPTGLFVDLQGNIYFADSVNALVRKVDTTGIITTVAGNGESRYDGDSGPATSASLSVPTGVWVLPDGTLYIADSQNLRVRKVAPDGKISTFAGNGQPGSGTLGEGNGGPATSAPLHNPLAVAADKAGNLYIADGDLIRRVDSNAIIHTFIEDKDGGGPFGMVFDQDGNLFFADNNNFIKKATPNGVVTTIAGNGKAGFSGDGGPALQASFNNPAFLAFDKSGVLYIGDQSNYRVRALLPAPPPLQVSPPQLSLSGRSTGAPSEPQSIAVSSTVTGVPFTVSVATKDGGNWLSADSTSGATPAQVQFSGDPAQLSPGTYTGIITIKSTISNSQVVTVSFSVGAALPPSLGVDSRELFFSFLQGGNPAGQPLTVSNRGDGTLAFSVTATANTGAQWLSIAQTTGGATPGSPVLLTVTADPTGLTPNTYTGKITVASADTGQQITIPVTLVVNPSPQQIVLSQTGMTFTAVAQGGTVLPQSLGVLNVGSGSMSWMATANTLSGPAWLSLSATSGTVNRPFLDVSFVDVSVDATSLETGTYYGNVQVTAPGASNSPQTVLVVLNVLQPGSNPGPLLRPTGLVFTGVAGASNPGSQNVTVADVAANSVNFGSSVTYVSAGRWITYLPANATVLPDTPTQILVQPDLTTLTPGVLRAALTLLFDDGSIRTVSLLSVVAPPGTAANATVLEPSDRLATGSNGCFPSKLSPVFSQLGSGSSVPTGWPVAIIVKVVDDCGSPLTSGSVVASFSNGDVPISLINLQDGEWSGTWQPRTASTIGVTVYVTAQLPDLNLVGTTQATISLQGNQALPLLNGAPVSAVTGISGPLAPGELVMVTGSALADGQSSSTSMPLPQQLAGATLLMGGRLTPLLYADNGQLVGIVPPDLPVNSSQQILPVRDNTAGVPSPTIIAATQPAVFTEDGSGKGQGLVYVANGGTAADLADPSHPVQSGDTVIIYCAGLGTLDAQGVVTNPVTVTIGGQTAQTSYAGAAVMGSFPPEGAPAILGVSTGLGGLYQIIATIPIGVTSGPAEVIVSSSGQTSQQGVTLVIAGSVAGKVPVITGTDAVGGFPETAQNDWIEIRGTSSTPAIVGPNGMTWDSAPEDASGRMPTQLGGVGVTVRLF
jgi:uncharacterized protein (TIGR03437 family)